MKKVIFHIGAHKTASTLLQNIWGATKNQLSNFSILYADSVEVTNTSIYLREKSPLPESLGAKLQSYYSKKYQFVKEDTVVMSSETFFGDPFKGYSDTPVVAKDARRILREFDVQVLAFVRRQDTFYESLYHQAIKQGASSTFEEFQQQVDPKAFKWDELLGCFAEYFGAGRMLVLPYEDFFHEQDTLYSRVFELLGLVNNGLQGKVGVANPSLNKKGLEIARRCNPILDNQDKRKLRVFLQGTFPKQLEEDFDLFTAEQRNDLITHYRDSNQNLYKRFIKGDYSSGYYLGEELLKKIQAG